MSGPRESDNRPVLGKWVWVGVYWVAQALAVWILPVIWAEAMPDKGSLFPVNLLAAARAATEWGWIVWAITLTAGMTALQAIFVWPVRRPAAKRARGWPVMVSLGVAGLTIGGLGVALSFVVVDGLDLAFHAVGTADQPATEFLNSLPISIEWIIGIWCLVNWVVGTLLLVKFCKRGPRESMLARLASRIFLGTVIEVAAIIPLDVMVRKRGSCYCSHGTYIGLSICGAVGMLVLGPAVFLPVVAKRRKRWYDGKCDACGYDMSGCVSAERCPECGVGWSVAAHA